MLKYLLTTYFEQGIVLEKLKDASDTVPEGAHNLKRDKNKAQGRYIESTKCYKEAKREEITSVYGDQ